MKSKENSKKERPRELSNNVGNRKPSKIIEVEDWKKRSSKIEGNINDVEDLKRRSLKMDGNINISSSITLVPATEINKLPVNSSTIGSLFLENPLSTSSSKTLANTQTGNVSVICRFRPLNEKEKTQTKDICVDFIDPVQLSVKSSAENNTYKFNFDKIFDMNSTQQEVYDEAAKPIIYSVLEGFNGTIFAYGQTASGKTHTMQGVLDDPEKEGIIPRMIRNVFSCILQSSNDIEFTVKVSMVEIYMEKIHDLIDTNRVNLNIREDRAKGIYIEDLSEHYVGGEIEVLDLMKVGSDNRAMAATNMNEQSSRSHSIFIMTIHQNNVKDLVAKTGKLYLVDLAGSEKISKTGATGSLLDEAKMINKSLTTLGMVINSLTDGKSQHIPYRESKLTRVLSESLGGNAKTCLVITCSPSTYNDAETLSTLRFGVRAKKIKNKPKINKEVTVAELKINIDKLERFIVTCNRRISQLEGFITKNNLNPPNEGDFTYLDSSETSEDKGKVVSNLDNDLIKIREEDLTVNERNTFENLYLTNGINNNDDFSNTLLDDLTSKYAGVTAQLNLMTDDKKELIVKLENAIGKIKEFSVAIECKERKINEFEDMKKIFARNEQELYDRIIKLQENLEIEKNTRMQEISEKEISDEIVENEIVEDEINNKFVKSKQNENFSKVIKKEVINNINEIERDSDEIYTHLNELLYFCNGIEDKESDKNKSSINGQLYSLLSLIRNKINIKEDCESPSVVEKNSEFEIIKSFSTVSTPISGNITPTSFNQSANSIIQNSINEESMKKEKRKFENEKKLILKALEEKTEKVKLYLNYLNKISGVDNENKELRERIKLLESKMNPDDKNYVKKIISLEKNLDQVNLMYHQVVTQKSVLKIENQVLEKKIKKRNEKISTFDKENYDLKEQLKMRDDKLNFYQKSYIKNINAPNNVVRVIKGGNNKLAETINTNNTSDIKRD